MTDLIPTVQPAEHCGDILDLPSGDDTTECVLRPGHSGSHADETGTRWRLTTPAPEPGLREQYAAALQRELTHYARSDIDPGTGSDVGDQVAIVLAVRDRRMEQLRARVVTLEHVAAGNKRHVQLIVPDLEKAEAAIERIVALADEHPVHIDTPLILAALDQPDPS